MTAVGLLRREASIIGEALLGSLIIALLAQVAIPLYFTPVPITGQTLAVMLVGLLFGPRGGVNAVLAYLAEGALGLPVFAGGVGGLGLLLGFKGGYYIAFLGQAYLAGCVARWDVVRRSVALMGIALLQMAFGTLWLSFFVGASAFAFGFLPFIFGEAFKVALLAAWRND